MNASELAELQRIYLELGLMHKITISTFLASECTASSSGGSGALNTPEPDWDAVDARWGKYINGTATLPFGLQNVAVTAIDLPNPFFGIRTSKNVSHAVIDQLWRRTGCLLPTPRWGYEYWGKQTDHGVGDMLTYCDHALACPKAKPECDEWAAACASTATGPVAACTLQPAPPPSPLNNTLANIFWRSAAKRAREHGWFGRMFDYTCDEPGSKPEVNLACRERGNSLHAAVPDMRSLITAEKAPADASNISAIIDVWVPIINYMDASETLCPEYPQWAMGNSRPDYDSVVAEGKALWWYVSASCGSKCTRIHLCLRTRARAGEGSLGVPP